VRPQPGLESARALDRFSQNTTDFIFLARDAWLLSFGNAV
jgi:hypothetical protein